jgi:hypothetical protein
MAKNLSTRSRDASPSRDSSPEREASPCVRCSWGPKGGWGDKSKCENCHEWFCWQCRVDLGPGRGYACSPCDDRHSLFECCACKKKGQHKDMNKCEDRCCIVCNSCVHRGRCPECHAKSKCSDCRALKGDPRCLGYTPVNCEHCSRPTCNSCIRFAVVGRKGSMRIRQLCPKCKRRVPK